MEKNNGLKEMLLEQADRGTGFAPKAPQEFSQTIIARHTARLKRLKSFVLAAWLLFAASCLASGISGALTGFRSEAWIISTIIGVQTLLILAVALTVALSLRSRSLKMSQIQAALAEIEDRLKTLAENR